MKKAFSWILSLALIFSLLPNQVFAASTLEFSSEKEGEKIVVTLTLPKYEKVMAAEAVVEFSDALKLESVTSGTYSPLDFEEPNVETATTKGKVTIPSFIFSHNSFIFKGFQSFEWALRTISAPFCPNSTSFPF